MTPRELELEQQLADALRLIQWLRFGGPILDEKVPNFSDYWKACSLYETHLNSEPTEGWVCP